MIFDITISNFGSIHNQLKIASLLHREMRITNSGFRRTGLGNGPLGPSRLMFLVGDNETGKTTILSALQCLHSLVTGKRDVEIPSTSFQLFNDENCSFRLNFWSEKTPYYYSIGVRDGHVMKEELFNRPNRRPTLLYRRTRINEGKSELAFGNSLQLSPAEKEILSTIPSDKQTVLSAYSTLNFHNPALETAWRYFSTQFCATTPMDDFTITAGQFIDIYPELMGKLMEMNEKGVHVDKEIIDHLHALGQTAARCRRAALETTLFNESMAHFLHTLSSGMSEFIRTLVTLMLCVRSQGVCTIDDFGDKMDFHKACAVLDYFLSQETCSQLFLSTHSSLLLDYGQLRREQVVFLYRDADGHISADQKLAKSIHKSISLANAYNRGLRPDSDNINTDNEDTQSIDNLE